jgi:hypothetical protein
MVSRAEMEAARGRKVQGADGRPMGTVLECRDDAFLCDHGGLWRTTWVVRFEDVARVEAEVVVLSRPASDYRGPTLGSGQVFKLPPGRGPG